MKSDDHSMDDDSDYDYMDEYNEEAAHFLSVCYAIANYSIDAMPEVCRIERYLRLLSPEDACMLIEPVDTRVNNIKMAVNNNQIFLDLLLIPHREEIAEHVRKTKLMKARHTHTHTHTQTHTHTHTLEYIHIHAQQ
eukprot:GHVR01019402.1.p1 GENE.GHVR01019402.1~~GHVR01019402.1.p1  ORF type:complete len:146 (-),score=72.87 GHVR01019402.1:10-417(-)